MSDSWQTPRSILDAVDALWPDGWFDPCPANPGFDGLSVEWRKHSFINPPFSEYLKWVEYGLTQKGDQLWVCHHDSSTKRMRLLFPGAALCLLSKRVKFIDLETGKPRGTDPAKSQTLIYRGEYPLSFAKRFQHLGPIYGAYSVQ